MQIETMKPMSVDETDEGTWVQKDAEGCINPFCQDLISMGTPIGRNVTVMHMNFPSQECESMVIVDTRTGERIRVTFSKAPEKKVSEIA